jgi:hypothetical protein
MPVVTHTTGWSPADLEARLLRGSHQSVDAHVDFVRDEMADFAAKGFWTVLPYDLVRHLPGLRLSPLGCVPQRNRRPRLIVDLSFYNVNADTVHLAPPEAMQFGRALDRFLYRLRHANPRFGPTYMSKIDISDGFYRVWLAARSAVKLAVVLPSMPGEPPLVAIPLSLPMGWVESPPTFCAVTETVADLANGRMHRRHAPPHRLETFADTLPEVVDTVPQPPSSFPPPVSLLSRLPAPLPILPVPSLQPLTSPLNYTDVYVDDFCNLVQGSRRRRKVVQRHLLHAIDEVFAPLDPSSTVHKEPISVKKLLQGDGCWATSKIILGWLLNADRQTLELPTHRFERLCVIFAELRGAKRVSVKTWHKLLGELRSMVLAIPGGRGLFSVLQTGFKHSDRHRIRIDCHLRAQLDDFEALVHDLHSRPTRLAEIVPDIPSGIGACDAAAAGMGGVWFIPGAPPLLWRAPFPMSIQRRLVTFDNPTGDLTNSDLELAGIIAHKDVLVQHVDARERTFSILCDNTPAVSRSRKGSVTSRSAAAYLLRLSSLHQRHHRYFVQHDHIAGSANSMADDASRAWHLSDSQLLSHFQQTYPQLLPWKLVPLRLPLLSALTSALRQQRVAVLSVLNEPPPRIIPGQFGSIFAMSTTSTPYWKIAQTQSRTFRSLHSDIATDALPKMATPSDLAQWRTPFVPLARRWPAWGPRTNALLPLAKSNTA